MLEVFEIARLPDLILMVLRAFHAKALRTLMSCSVELTQLPRYLKSWTCSRMFPLLVARGFCDRVLQDKTLVLLALKWSPTPLHSSSTLDNSFYACSRSFDSKAMSSAKSRSVMTFPGIRRERLGVTVKPSSSSFPLIACRRT